MSVGLVDRQFALEKRAGCDVIKVAKLVGAELYVRRDSAPVIVGNLIPNELCHIYPHLLAGS
jgi:hypothetical protein